MVDSVDFYKIDRVEVDFIVSVYEALGCRKDSFKPVAHREIKLKQNTETTTADVYVCVLRRLFVLPQYCGTLLEQCLMLNRRRNNLEDVVKSTQGGASVGLRAEQSGSHDLSADDSVSIVDSVISETERLRIREGAHTRIYVCATMWHETANEMVQVLKSIMRYFVLRHTAVVRHIPRLISGLTLNSNNRKQESPAVADKPARRGVSK